MRWLLAVRGYLWCSGLMSVREEIGRLRFVASSAPAIYLNERLAEELFLAQLGAIGAFTRSAAKGVNGSFGPSILKIGLSKDGSEQVTYDLDNPLTKALILHSALGGATAVALSSQSRAGAFAEVVGPVHLPPAMQATPPPSEATLTRIQSEKDRQADILQALGDSETVLLPLLVLDAGGTVGSIIDRRWLRAAWAASYLSSPQVAFGLVERVVADLPLITLIYLRPYI